jgi:uncharacterized protein (TIGR00645 family)
MPCASISRCRRTIEMVVLQSRWLQAPFLLGLIIGLGALLYTFVVKLTSFLALVNTAPEEEVIVGVLKLVDLSLTANLLLIACVHGRRPRLCNRQIHSQDGRKHQPVAPHHAALRG